MLLRRRGLGLALTALPLAARRAGAAPGALTPDADALLRRPSDTLSPAPSLALDLGVLREVRMEDGRTATLMSDVGIALRRPDRLRANIRGDAVVADVYAPAVGSMPPGGRFALGSHLAGPPADCAPEQIGPIQFSHWATTGCSR